MKSPFAQTELILSTSQASADSVSAAIREFGVVVLPGYLPLHDLEALNSEFDSILAQGATPTSGIVPIKLEPGRGAVVTRLALDPESFPATISSFGTSFMQEVSNSYWGAECVPNEQIYVMNEVVGTKHIAQDLHFDVQKTLKFFVYLTDTTAANGAFSCVPGSHLIARRIRDESGVSISYENREVTRQLPFDEEEVVSVEGVAGTLIVFTTEVFHRAGVVAQGERRIMRGHTRPKK
jgi:hypothetical protein